MAALRAFLLAILPTGTEVVQGQDNRVPEPSEGDFVVMTPLRRDRLATNTDTYNDCQFTASISALLMTVSQVQFGSVTPGNSLFGTGVSAGTIIGAQASGPSGGAGTYAVSISQAVASETMACGVENHFEPVDLVVQIDVHSANLADSADMGQTIATLLRDDYANQFFFDNGFSGISPLYADDPRQVPFMNAEQQFETRWIVEAHIQVNAIIITPQQFADQLKPTLVEIDATYPARDPNFSPDFGSDFPAL